MSGGIIFGQIITILVSPILTRLYTPEEMGIWGLFLSFVSIASTVGTLRYDVAIVAAKKEKEALLITQSLLYCITLITTVVFGCVFIFLYRYNIFGYSVFPRWAILIIILGLIATVWSGILRYWAMRKAAFATIGSFSVIQSLFRALGQIIFAFTGSFGLLFGDIIGRLAGVAVLWRTLPRLKKTWCSKKILIKYRAYPFIQLPSSFLDNLAMMAPVPIFTAVYGTVVGGELTLAQRVVFLPLTLIGSAIADVFYSRVAQIVRKDVSILESFLLKIMLRLTILSLFLGAFLWFFAPRLVLVIFGSSWERSGWMVKAMVPWLFFLLVVNPVSRIVFLSRYMWVKIFYDLISLLVITLPLYLHINDPIKSLWLISWLKAMQLIFYMLFLLVIVRRGAFYG